MKNVLSCLPVAFLACLAVIPCGHASAQNWNVLLIPDSLRKGARAIIREEEVILEIKSPSKMIEKERHVFTVMDESGDNLGGYTTYYGKFNDVNSVTGVLYDAMGKEVKRVKKKDMEDKAAYDGESLVLDERYKEFNFYCRNYPYTVDYTEEDEFNGILHFREWRLLLNSGISTQHTKYVIIAPKDYQVRYKPANCSIQPVITESGDKKIYTWEASNLPARHTESNGPSWSEITPRILFAPSDFEAQGYKGNMSTWTNYGKFMNQLLAGRDVLPDDIKRKVHELTDNLKTPREKVFALYDFLQKNTHYVGIQLGIGGYQPFPAQYVATKRYGDCKALSNYMVALLKEAGINAKYVEIFAGPNAPPLVEDFPCFQGNHVICCVPMNKDTIWLECTNQTVSPGYMGSFTGNRRAILLDDDGAHIVRTPSYSASDNLQCRVVNAEISTDGNLEAEVNTTYSGISQDEPQVMMDEMSADQREKKLNEEFDLPTYKVDKNRYEEQKGPLPVVKEYLHVTSPNYASVSGRRLFIAPNIFDKNDTRLSADSVRKYDFVKDEAYKEIDSVSIRIPSGYQAEAVPAEVHVDSKYGKFSASVKVLPDKIVYYRSYEESAARFPPTEYPGLVKYYDQLYKADHGRVVLVKKD